MNGTLLKLDIIVHYCLGIVTALMQECDSVAPQSIINITGSDIMKDIRNYMDTGHFIPAQAGLSAVHDLLNMGR